MTTSDDLIILLHTHRIGHLATADREAMPHVIPVCFAYDGPAIYSALDHKPKRQTGYRMKRIRNIVDNPRVAFLVHHYEEDWQRLYYVLIRGPARLLERGDEHQHALTLLEQKYRQYQERQLARSDGLVIKIVPETITRWGGGGI